MAEENISKMNLYQRLAKIRKLTEVIQKNKAGYGYKYTDIAEILSHVTAGMNKYNVSLVPHVDEDASVAQYNYTKMKVLKSGERYEEPVTEFLATSKIIYSWINNDNPEEHIDVPWYIAGSQTDPSQALGSALTYGMRYFLLNYFQIATPEDDPDAWRSKQKEAEESEGKTIADTIIKKFDVEVKQFLADNQDLKNDVAKFVSKFAKNGNYFAIQEPTLASKLMEDFHKTFIKEEK